MHVPHACSIAHTNATHALTRIDTNRHILHICTLLHLYSCTHRAHNAGLYTSMNTHRCIYLMRVHLDIQAHMQTCTYTSMLMHLQICACTHHAYMQTYILIHMHMYTHMFQPLHGDAAGKVEAVVTVRPCEYSCPCCVQGLFTPSCNN